MYPENNLLFTLSVFQEDRQEGRRGWWPRRDRSGPRGVWAIAKTASVSVETILPPDFTLLRLSVYIHLMFLFAI